MKTAFHSKHYIHSANTTLGPLAARLAGIQRWNLLLAEALPKEHSLILSHCHAVHADPTSLTLVADSPHWATRLRFLTPTIIENFRKYPEFAALKSIHCKIAPGTGQGALRRSKKPKMPLSHQNAELMLMTAETIRHDRLKKILQRMAKK